MSHELPLDESAHHCMIILLTGVTTSGKSTIGWMLAETIDWNFIDADYLHSHEAILKQSRGLPLTPRDRVPWLSALREIIHYSLDDYRNLIIACSSLRDDEYSALPLDSQNIKVLNLKGSLSSCWNYPRRQRDSVTTPTLLTMPLAVLEQPRSHLEIEMNQPPEQIVRQIMLMLDLWDRN